MLRNLGRRRRLLLPFWMFLVVHVVPIVLVVGALCICCVINVCSCERYKVPSNFHGWPLFFLTTSPSVRLQPSSSSSISKLPSTNTTPIQSLQSHTSYLQNGSTNQALHRHRRKSLPIAIDTKKHTAKQEHRVQTHGRSPSSLRSLVSLTPTRSEPSPSSSRSHTSASTPTAAFQPSRTQTLASLSSR